MKSQNIQELINRFFGNTFSKNTQLLFRYWFRLNNDQNDKDFSMQDVWEVSPSTITSKTWEDLAKLQSHISQTEIRTSNSIFRVILKYAAILLLVASSSIFTHYFVSKANEKQTEFVEFFVPYGNSQKVLLADGSTVWVNAGSVLIYPKEFNDHTRSVYLSGEANFQVAKNPNQPFIVKTKHINVEALGTTFIVQAYPSSLFTIATLEEGSIRVDIENSSNHSTILKPNEQLAYSHVTNNISIQNVNAEKLATWKEGYLLFREASFENIMATLERKYNVQINYDTEKFNKQSYNIRFNPNETLEDVFAILSQITNNFKYSIQKSTVYIK